MRSERLPSHGQHAIKLLPLIVRKSDQTDVAPLQLAAPFRRLFGPERFIRGGLRTFLRYMGKAVRANMSEPTINIPQKLIQAQNMCHSKE
jgi:hypothetical protein